jgi:hypothetical protein
VFVVLVNRDSRPIENRKAQVVPYESPVSSERNGGERPSRSGARSSGIARRTSGGRDPIAPCAVVTCRTVTANPAGKRDDQRRWQFTQ